MSSQFAPEQVIKQVLGVLSRGDGFLAALESLPVPIYVTDADGFITYFNSACVNFAGRTPVVGKDRWCVTWKLYTDQGVFLPHDECPMAEAITRKQPIRGVSALAERPDGTRVNFMPYPTPLFGPDGGLRGAVNMLLDITDARQAQSLRSQASRCWRLAAAVGDDQAREALEKMAASYEQKAASLEPK